MAYYVGQGCGPWTGVIFNRGRHVFGPPHWFDLPLRHGEIESIRVLHERFCAFVNFKSAGMAARAMEKLHVSVPTAGWTWLWPVPGHCAQPRLLGRVSTSRTPGWWCATLTAAHPGRCPFRWRRVSRPRSRRGWLPGKPRPLLHLCLFKNRQVAAKTFLSLDCVQTAAARPSQRRRVLLLENNRLPLWGQMPL